MRRRSDADPGKQCDTRRTFWVVIMHSLVQREPVLIVFGRAVGVGVQRRSGCNLLAKIPIGLHRLVANQFGPSDPKSPAETACRGFGPDGGGGLPWYFGDTCVILA